MKKRFGLVALALIAWMGASAQHPCESKYGSDSAETVKNVGLFNMHWQNKNYVEAFPYWYYQFKNAPCYNKRVTLVGSYLVEQYLLHLQKNDPQEFNRRKNGLIDTMLLNYDVRVYYWGEAGKVAGYKAIDMINWKADTTAALVLFDSCFRNLGNETDAKVVYNYFYYALNEYAKKNYEADRLFKLYFDLLDVVNYNIDADTAKAETWRKVDTAINFAIRPFMTCEKIEELYKAKTDDPNVSMDLLKRVNHMLQVAGCDGNDYSLDLAEKMYNLDPSGEAAINLARYHNVKGNDQKSLEWYNKGLGSVNDASEKAKIYSEMSSIYTRMGNLAKAKEYAEKVLSINPNDGKAHLIIASYFAQSSGSCTSDGLGGRTAFLAAYDRAAKAKSLDPSVESAAQELMNKCYANFPSSEDVFKASMHEGDSISVPCLGVTTTIRFRK
ncbi:MAG: hypothetical protein H6607_01945 [Flavobacteriales bacterium]|nr:hypothetical protein [Flavobacteriales bacterium]